jgi:hypothetical protein
MAYAIVFDGREASKKRFDVRGESFFLFVDNALGHATRNS